MHIQIDWFGVVYEFESYDDLIDFLEDQTERAQLQLRHAHEDHARVTNKIRETINYARAALRWQYPQSF